ncbi:MAG: hypothetical protein ACO2PN_20305 [Pyrobaculum sp.]
MTLPKLRAGPLAALVVLALFVVSAAAERVYVYEVESDVEITEDVPHVPGISWRFGEQLLVVWVPRDVAPGIILFTNETASIPLYDRRYFLLVVPADARPNQRARAEALLKTPDGTHPVVFRKPDAGIIDITARSIEEALTTLKQIGLQPEYRGKAELKKIDTAKRDPDAGRETAADATPAPTQVSMPTTGSLLDVYGGLYFRETLITRTGQVYVPVHGAKSACIDLGYAAYVGYDVRGFVLGTWIIGGTVDADLIVDVYRIQNDGSCRYLGSQTFRLANNTRYWVSRINPTTSVDELAVFVWLRVRSFSGQPRVSAYASVLYTRTYRHGFEVGEFAARTSGEGGYWINNYVRRVVIGPYVAYDGYIARTASSSLRLKIATEPVNRVCKDLRVRFTINGRSSIVTSTYRGIYNSGVCSYDVNLPRFDQSTFQFEYSYAKAFGGGLAWVLDIEYTDGSTPYVRTIYLENVDAFRYWRWAEQWRTIDRAVDGSWKSAFLSSAFELYAAPTEPSPAPGIYHGLVTVRANHANLYNHRVILTISGRYIYPRYNYVVYINRAEIDLYIPLDVRGINVMGEAYLMPDNRINPINPPQWVEIVLRVKDAVDFILTAAGIGGRAFGLLSFAAGQGLQSAGDSVRAEVRGLNNATITYQRGWGTNVASDTIIAPLTIPSLYNTRGPTELVITRICLDSYCVNPNLKAYVQPDSTNWTREVATVKNWMFRGQVDSTTTYDIPMR